MGSKALCRSTNRSTGWSKEVPKVSRALFKQAGQLSTGSTGCTTAGLAKSSAGS